MRTVLYERAAITKIIEENKSHRKPIGGACSIALYMTISMHLQKKGFQTCEGFKHSRLLQNDVKN